MNPSIIDPVEELTRKAVIDVFRTMLAMPLTANSPEGLGPDPDGQIVGTVGFTGKVNGLIHIHATVSFAREITARMLGLELAQVDSGDGINDALGELSNMVVGTVKSSLCDRGWTCTLTVPSVLRGRDISVRSSPTSTRRVLGFKNCAHHLLAELAIKTPTD